MASPWDSTKISCPISIIFALNKNLSSSCALKCHISTVFFSGVPKKDVYDIIQMINKFSRIRSTSLFEDKSNPFNFMQGLRGTDNVYTQHRTFLSKDILPDVIKGRIRQDLEYLDGVVVDGFIRPIVVFMVGGITYEESRSIHVFNKEFGSNVVIGGTSIINLDSFLEDLKIACN